MDSNTSGSNFILYVLYKIPVEILRNITENQWWMITKKSYEGWKNSRVDFLLLPSYAYIKNGIL